MSPRDPVQIQEETDFQSFPEMLPLLITMGEPAGVGPELALKGCQWATAHRIPTAIVGSYRVLARVAEKLALPLPPRLDHTEFVEKRLSHEWPMVIDLPGLDADAVVPGQFDRASGAASFQAVVWAIDRVLAAQGAAVVTGPIQKEGWALAGINYPGHTELLAEQTGAASHCMMLAADEIKCALVTVHVGLAEVPTLLTIDAILETIELAGEAVRNIIHRQPRIAVCGLNPHAGEGGLFGRGEEERIIQPAIQLARQRGWNVRGPLPADTAFIPQLRAQTDLYICMYHDQGLIPLKTIAFDDAVNITLGLPIIRTSVDHGTALDIAWQGIANPASMQRAIALACRLIAKRPTSH
jgi:4-hydroxythreonine-4-phosphate dehydrogenase